MAELPRYRGVTTQVQSGAKAHMAQARSIDSFIQGVKGIERGATDMLATQSIEQAKVDAQTAFTTEGKNAEISDSMSVYGQQYRQSLRNLQKKQVSIDTTKKFNDLYTANKDNPALFEEVTNAYRDKALKDMPEHQKADFVIDYEANKAQFGARIKENRINADKEKAYAAGVEYHTQKVEKLSQAFRDGSYERGIAEASMAKENIQDLAESGLIKKSKAVEMLNAIDKKITWSNFKGINDRYINDGDLEGAQKAIEKFRKTNVPGIDDMGREQLADSMQADLNREVARLKAENSYNSKYDNKEAKKLTKLLNDGEDVEDDVINATLESNVSATVAEDLILAKLDNAKIKKFSSMDIADQEADIKEARAKTGKTADELRLINKKEKALEQQVMLRDEDPLVYSQGKHFDGELEYISLNDVDFADKIFTREEQTARSNHSTGKRSGIFTKEEIKENKQVFKTMTLQEKMGFIDNINSLEDFDIAENTFTQMGGEALFAGMMVQTGNREAAEMSLLGKGADVQLEEAFTKNLKTKMAGVYSGYGQEFINANIDGITNYAKGMIANGQDLSYTEAIEMSIGQVATYSGQKTVLPYGVDKGQFEDWIDNITIKGKPALTKALNNLTDLWSPDSEFQLRYAGQGKYYVIDPNDGNPAAVRGDDGKPFILDYNKREEYR